MNLEPDELAFFRLIFTSVLSMQYHPRNEVFPDQDAAVIARCLSVAHKAFGAFTMYVERDCAEEFIKQYYNAYSGSDDDVPF